MDADKLVGLVEHAIGQAVARLDARLIVVEGKATALDVRVGAVESMRPIPGPVGPQGPSGPPGRDGLDGKDGIPGLTYRGVYQAGTAYAKGDVVTWNGSAWHANDTIGTERPGDGSPGWTLMVKHGGK
jgi:hypothetical protein